MQLLSKLIQGEIYEARYNNISVTPLSVPPKDVKVHKKFQMDISAPLIRIRNGMVKI